MYICVHVVIRALCLCVHVSVRTCVNATDCPRWHSAQVRAALSQTDLNRCISYGCGLLKFVFYMPCKPCMKSYHSLISSLNTRLISDWPVT